MASFSVEGNGNYSSGKKLWPPSLWGGGTGMGQGLCLRKGKWGREIAPRLKTLAEVSDSVPSSHMVAHNHAKSQGIRCHPLTSSDAKHLARGTHT